MSKTIFSVIGRQFSLKHVQQQHEHLSRNCIKSRQIAASANKGRVKKRNQKIKPESFLMKVSCIATTPKDPQRVNIELIQVSLKLR